MKFLKEKFKSFNLKKVLRGFVVLVGLGMIVFMTLTNLGFSDEFNFIDWLGNVLILVGIAVFFLLIGESSGYDRQRDRVVRDENGNIIGGLFQKVLAELNAFLESIDDIKIFFDQFYKWNTPIQLLNKKIEFLVSNGVDQRKAEKIVKYCTLSDLYNLKSGTYEYTDPENEKHKVVIRKLEEYEVLPVEEVLKGHIKLHIPAASFYLCAFGKADNNQMFEKPVKLQADIKSNKRINRAVKIATGVFISLIWALLTVKDFAGGNDTQAWLNLVSRLLMALTSFLSGWLSSVITVRLEAEILINKLDVLKMFKSAHEKHLFPELSAEELDQQELEETRKEQEKAKENVVIPEPVNEESPQIPLKPKLIEGGN